MSVIIEAARFNDLPGWAIDTHTQTMAAFEKSCARFLRRGASTRFGPALQWADETEVSYGATYGDWHTACRALQDMSAAQKNDPDAVRAYFEQWFTPYLVRTKTGQTKGMFTGYYEASLKGSAVRTDRYNIPLHARPDDLVMVDLGAFRESLKGQRIAGRVRDGRLRPYEDRSEIVSGQWPHNDKVLVWVDDAVDAFFVQIQGSGRVAFEDGSAMRIGYAGQNGHPYYAIGRELVKRGYMDKDSVSMQSIRDHLANNPAQADEIMNTNPSYVFFRALETDGPVGGEGLPLTPGRSLAIDHTKFGYGTPMWVDIEHPDKGTNLAGGVSPLQRLMIAQDTGGAIRGVVRGDYFWGYGAEAAAIAGRMKSQGQYWVLLPQKR